jgi:hypothetical protein
MDVQVDLMNTNGGTGDVANQLMANGRLDIAGMRPFIGEDGKTYISVFKGGDPKIMSNYTTIPLQVNGTLRRDEWKVLDDAVMRVARERLVGINDLISRGLTYNLTNAMGTTVLEWHDVSDSMEAVMTMDGVTRGKGDRPVFKHNYIPIPIIHVDYEINSRVLAASRNMGNPLDATSAEHAARRVAEKLEDMLFTDTTYSWGEKDARDRNSIYSYVNFPDRNEVIMDTAWTSLTDDSDGTVGKKIVDDVLSMKQASIDARHYGPDWVLYIPTAYETLLDADYDSTTPGTTIRERIMKISGIKSITVVDRLAANNVLLVEMRSDNVRLIEGIGLQNVEWQTEGRFITKYKVLTIRVPQIRSDQDGKCGIVHLAPKPEA